MPHRLTRFYRYGLLLAVALLLGGCAWFGNSAVSTRIRPRLTSLPATC